MRSLAGGSGGCSMFLRPRVARVCSGFPPPHADVGSPSPGTVRAFAGGSLPSWNPNVACAADLVAVRDVLGSAYPNQALIGSRYPTNSKAGGVPNNWQLLPPGLITNATHPS